MSFLLNKWKVLSKRFLPFSCPSAQCGAKRRNERAGPRSGTCRRSADRFSDLLAPCESAREAFIYIIMYESEHHFCYHCANKERKSDSLAPHCRRAQRGGNNDYTGSVYSLDLCLTVLYFKQRNNNFRMIIFLISVNDP
ncbi:MAG: hypothetical protein V1878_06495, partial [bacterium]